jgi:hypothetical protein
MGCEDGSMATVQEKSPCLHPSIRPFGTMRYHVEHASDDAIRLDLVTISHSNLARMIFLTAMCFIELNAENYIM